MQTELRSLTCRAPPAMRPGVGVPCLRVSISRSRARSIRSNKMHSVSFGSHCIKPLRPWPPLSPVGIYGNNHDALLTLSAYRSASSLGWDIRGGCVLFTFASRAFSRCPAPSGQSANAYEMNVNGVSGRTREPRPLPGPVEKLLEAGLLERKGPGERARGDVPHLTIAFPFITIKESEVQGNKNTKKNQNI